MTAICSWCGRIKIAGVYVDDPQAATMAMRAGPVTHGLCPDCEVEQNRLFDEMEEINDQ